MQVAQLLLPSGYSLCSMCVVASNSSHSRNMNEAIGLSRRAATKLVEWGVPYVVCPWLNVPLVGVQYSCVMRVIERSVPISFRIDKMRILMCDYITQLNLLEREAGPMWRRAAWFQTRRLKRQNPLKKSKRRAVAINSTTVTRLAVTSIIISCLNS